MLRKYIARITLLLILVGIIFLWDFYSFQTIKASEKLSQFSNKTNLNAEEMWGGPEKDLFPDIVNPKYVDSKEAGSFIKDDEDVFLFQAKNKTYVYPISIMTFHHIVNDNIEGIPVAITYCLLSNTPAAFSRELEGETLEFGVLGALYYGNLIMYDKVSDTYWLQLTGESFRGKFSGKRLEPIGFTEQTKWKNIKDRRDLLVLSPQKDIEFYRSRYIIYKNSNIGLASLPPGKQPDARLSEFANGLGIVIGKEEKFFPTSFIERQKVINSVVGPWAVLVVFDEELGSHKIFRRFIDGKRLTFEIRDGKLIDKETKSVWDYNGNAVSGNLKGKKLEAPFHTQAFWYSWSSFYPETIID